MASNTISYIMLLHTLAVLVLPCITMAMCPALCHCPNSTSQVSCDDADLQDIPRNLPQSITTLDMSGNQLHVINVDSLNTLRNVVNLKLKLNEISTIQDGSFENMDSLQTLDLSENRITSIHQRTFAGALKLLHLDLSSNDLDHIDGAFADMVELSRLDLRNNRITNITQFTFRDLANLRYLLLTENKISHIDRRAFANLSKLMYLVLKGNPIHRVSKFEFNSYFLSYVDLAECGLKKMPRGLPNSIRYLQLRRNNMTNMNRHSFQDCPYVSILVLDENGIERIHDKTFQHMTYLQQLWLNGNKLTTIPKPLPSSLQRILMDQNRITNITNVFPDNSELHTLSFMGNNISYVAYDAFLPLPDLKSVDLSNNRIEHIYGNTYMNSSKLKTLQLSKNPLKYFHSHAFHGLVNLKTLSLAYVQTNVSMHPDIFRDLTKLKKLDLDSSPGVVRSIFSSDVFLRGLGSVEDLSMQSCELTTLRGDFPDFFPNLKVLHISSGRWHCDTRMLWFRNWLLSTSAHIEAKDDIVCFTPHDLYSKPIISLSDYDFEQATTPRYTTTTTTAPLTTFGPTTTPTRRRNRPTKQTTAAPTSSTAAAEQKSTASSETKDSKESYEYEYEDYGIDLEDLLSDFENSQKFDPFSSQESANRNLYESSTRVLTWEEFLSRTLAPARGSRYWESSTRDPSSSSRESKYKNGDYNSNVDIRTLDRSTIDPYRDPASQEDSGGGGVGKTKTTIIVVATTLATVVIAAILISTIVYLSRKQKRTRKGKNKNKKEVYTNGIKYKHRNDVLYFMPANGEGGGEGKEGEKTEGSTKGSSRGSTKGSTTDSLKSSKNSKEGMTLIPGRDINHEGPHRVYRWEEF